MGGVAKGFLRLYSAEKVKTEKREKALRKVLAPMYGTRRAMDG